jgi:aminomethyltransferase
MAAFEMNHFREAWQQAVLANAKAFAVALHDAGLDVAGDPAAQYTETHQVVVRVGYGRGPDVAGRLEDSGIIVNYQAAPDEEGFTAAGALRLGVAEMTRFGMGPEQFAEAARLMAAVIIEGRGVAAEVRRLRRQFTDLGFCFTGPEFDPLLQRLHDLI